MAILMPPESSTSRLRVLHFTCSQCGAVRHYRCDPMPNGIQLDRMKNEACRECGGHGGAVSIIQYNAPIPYQLEALPLYFVPTSH
jgi:hypothetical protein